ncbi:hypothetical protein [Christiangramia echinicola]|uniref:hypothetical protein n=1 Tax=Christiangramia echinicola TaxID=279359 RepID=UPI00040F0D30|nr:hypothetical protein [Christiangramia echinicola]
MKKLALILLSIVTLTSCSINDDNGPAAEYELATITGNDLPDSFELGKSYTITLDYDLPSQCHSFAALDARRGGSTGDEKRQIYAAVVSILSTNAQCNEDVAGNSGTTTFNILIDEPEDYKFYFWTGTDADDQPIYTEVTVPVTEAG